MSFTVYKSSAGSGKTFTLVREYLALVLQDPWKYKRILAITFTNKAANEMKERVIDSLVQIGNMQHKPLGGSVAVMFNQLKEKLGYSEEKLVENAQQVTRLILHQYTDFAISTIDSFVHKIIRSFAFDLRLPMGFEVEMEAEETLRRVIDMLVSKAGTDDQLTDLLVKFTQSKTDNEQSWTIEEDIYKVARLLLDEDSQAQVQGLKALSINDFMQIRAALAKFIAVYEKTLNEHGSRAMQLIGAESLEAGAFSQGNRGIYTWFKRFANSDFSGQQPGKYVISTVEEDKWYSGKASDSEKAAIDRIKHQLSDIYLEIVRFIEQHAEQYTISQLAINNLYPMAILHEIESLLEEYRSENNLLLISDFNRRISKVVASEPVPFIYERVGEKYQHYLVDEFQDTSLLQWHNLLPLYENSLGTSNFNMIVGDAKQAIYRWRSGEVEQFIRLPKLYKATDLPFSNEREQVLLRNHVPMELKHNYRSAKQLVEFNNGFFKTVSDLLPEHYREVYLNAGQIAGSSNEGGYVEIDFYKKDSGDSERSEYYLHRVTEIIKHHLSLQYQPGDMAILCRNNASASLIAAHLLVQNIPVVSSESLLLTASINVRTLVAVARMLLTPGDQVARMELVNWLQQNKALQNDWPSHMDALVKIEDDKNFRTAITDRLEKLGFKVNFSWLTELSVYEFCEELIRSFKMHQPSDPYLSFFMDAVLVQMKDPLFDLKAMIDWWEHKKESLSIVVPAAVNAVKVMTIHKSKGLEFPVVIYPFAHEKQKNSKEKLWADPGEFIPGLNSALLDASGSLTGTRFEDIYHDEKNKSQLDLLNLLYVVMTRAADRLYIISEKPPKSPEATSVPVILQYYLQSGGYWQEEVTRYSFGDATTQPKAPGKPLAAPNPVAGLHPSVDWRNLVALSLQAPEYWDVDSPVGDQEWGTLLHKMLSEIRSKEQIDQVVSRFAGNGLIEMPMADKIKNQLTAFITHPEVEPYFNPEHISFEEIDLLLPSGDVQRPDRIIVAADQTMVIDYKTGRKSDGHIKQVKSYIKTLEQIGYKQVKGVLLYIFESNPVEEVLL